MAHHTADIHGGSHQRQAHQGSSQSQQHYLITQDSEQQQRQPSVEEPEAEPGETLMYEVAHQWHTLPSDEGPIAAVPDQEGHNLVTTPHA
jgi:hypothetical protein